MNSLAFLPCILILLSTIILVHAANDNKIHHSAKSPSYCSGVLDEEKRIYDTLTKYQKKFVDDAAEDGCCGNDDEWNDAKAYYIVNHTWPSDDLPDLLETCRAYHVALIKAEEVNQVEKKWAKAATAIKAAMEAAQNKSIKGADMIERFLKPKWEKAAKLVGKAKKSLEKMVNAADNAYKFSKAMNTLEQFDFFASELANDPGDFKAARAFAQLGSSFFDQIADVADKLPVVGSLVAKMFELAADVVTVVLSHYDRYIKRVDYVINGGQGCTNCD